MAYKTMWEIEVRHRELGKYRHIRGSDKYVVEQKAQYQKMQWDEQWQRKVDADRRAQEKSQAAQQRTAERDRGVQEKERLREETALEKARIKEEAQRYKDDRKQDGVERDAEAKEAIETLNNILSHTLKINDAIDWNKLKDKSVFEESPPKLKLPPFPEGQTLQKEPFPVPVPAKPPPAFRHNAPAKDDQEYEPVFSFLDKIFSSRKSKKIAKAENFYQQDYAIWVSESKRLDEHDAIELVKWEDNKKYIESRNVILRAEWERAVERANIENSSKKSWWETQCKQLRAIHSDSMQVWEQRKVKFYERQNETNAAIDQNRIKYMAKEQGAVSDYCDTVLSNSDYPDYFPKDWDLDYNADTRTLMLEYVLPAPEMLPTLKEVQYGWIQFASAPLWASS